ncbi:MAG: hypothetical protein H7Z19_19330 [Chitinophagaceae bacterium]|nr:hypothetical protein [Rubrivivax sp.]
MIAIHRWVDADGVHVAEDLLIVLNFADVECEVWLSFPAAGRWTEQIDGRASAIDVQQALQLASVRVPSNYGAVYQRL